MAADIGLSFAKIGHVFPTPPRRLIADPAEGGRRSVAAREADQLVLLLQDVAGSDPKALQRLYDRTSSKLYGVILHIVKDRSDAEDVLQGVYLIVWRRADRYDVRKGAALTWLCAIARNHAIDLLRLRPGRPLRAPESDLEGIPDSAPSTLEQLQCSEESRQLQRALDQLDARAAWAIRTAFFTGATYSDLARLTGVPLGTMKSCIRRGLLQLRGLLSSEEEV